MRALLLVVVACVLGAHAAAARHSRGALFGPYRAPARVECGAAPASGTALAQVTDAGGACALQTTALVRAWGALVHDDLADNGELDLSVLYGCTTPQAAALRAPLSLRDAVLGALGRFHADAAAAAAANTTAPWERFEAARARTIAAAQRATTHDFAARVLARPAAAASAGVGAYGSRLAQMGAGAAAAAPFSAFCGADAPLSARLALGGDATAALLTAAASAPACVGALDSAALDAALLGVRARDRYWYEWHFDGAARAAGMTLDRLLLGGGAPAPSAARAVRDAPCNCTTADGDDDGDADGDALDGWLGLGVPALSALLLLGLLLLVGTDRTTRGAPHADDPAATCPRCDNAAAHLAAGRRA